MICKSDIDKIATKYGLVKDCYNDNIHYCLLPNLPIWDNEYCVPSAMFTVYKTYVNGYLIEFYESIEVSDENKIVFKTKLLNSTLNFENLTPGKLERLIKKNLSKFKEITLKIKLKEISKDFK